MNVMLLVGAVAALSAVSPDGRNEIRVTADGALSYSVLRDGKTRLGPAKIALAVRGKPLSAEIAKDEPFELSGTVSAPLYKKSSVSLAAKGRRITLKGGYGLELVARDDGVAYRFTTAFPEAEVLVDGETAPLVFPSDDVSVWTGYPDVFPDADKSHSGLSNWEPVYTNLTAAQVGLKADRMTALPLVAEYADGTCVAVTESDQRDYPGWLIRGSGTARIVDGWFAHEPVEEKCEGQYHLSNVVRHDYVARTAGTRTYPWRLFQIASCAAKLCEGDAVYALAEPCKLADTSWIKPGLAQWEWWHDWNLSGVDFKAGKNTKTYLHYIDFAAEHGVPYVIMDGGWSKDYKLMNAIPEIDLRKVAAYAVRKGVGLILWSPWAAFIDNREEMIRTYASVGVRGFKLDGICRNDRYLTKYLEDTARLAAKYRMVVDYHGVSKPSGLSRTYPNVLTFEGVHGLENTKWEGDWMPKCDFPQCDLTDYFCRMTAGPMDYTPGAMRNFASNEYHCSYSLPGSQGTRVRQLAMFTMFESPLQMLCDSPSAYRREAECFSFLSKVPTVWDETVGLSGVIGRFAAVARRKGDVWHVGAMTDWTARELKIDTDFLKTGAWDAEIFADGANADRVATDYVRMTRTVKAGETLCAKLAPGGGWTARFVRKAEPTAWTNVVTGTCVGDVTISAAATDGWRFEVARAAAADGEVVKIALTRDAEAVPPKFDVSFSVPQHDIHFVWNTAAENPALPPKWHRGITSSLTKNMPLVALLNANDEAKVLFAASEAVLPVQCRAGLREEDCTVPCSLSFFTQPVSPKQGYTVEILLRRPDGYWADAVREATAWMEKAGGYRPMASPDAAFDSLYSTWYAFTQDVSAETIEDEARRAAKLGMKTLILDDGWQTDEKGRAYERCGDLTVSSIKFPDGMAAHVRRVQAEGVRYMVWFTVSMVGYKNAEHERFKGMYLKEQETVHCSILDPRFPEVRAYIVGMFERAMREWGVDGFKIDYVGQFSLEAGEKDPAVAEDFAGRDTRSVPDAVDLLMTELTKRLTAIKPDVLIEYRQPYLGPAIRRYGNMIRAIDCPGEMQKNIVRTAMLRLTSGDTAVHSDMLEWNATDTPECAAKPVLAALFSTIQYSMVLSRLPEAHVKMLTHWIRFTQEHRETLLKAAFRPHHPEANYPLVEAEGATERIVAVYAPGTVVPVKDGKRTFVVNATGGEDVVVDLPQDVTVTVFDVFGTKRGFVPAKAGLSRIRVPESGYLLAF